MTLATLVTTVASKTLVARDRRGGAGNCAPDGGGRGGCSGLGLRAKHFVSLCRREGPHEQTGRFAKSKGRARRQQGKRPHGVNARQHAGFQDRSRGTHGGRIVD
eukprot:scaffold67019_cov53-Attheya_sp.AAC.1